MILLKLKIWIVDLQFIIKKIYVNHQKSWKNQYQKEFSRKNFKLLWTKLWKLCQVCNYLKCLRKNLKVRFRRKSKFQQPNLGHEFAVKMLASGVVHKWRHGLRERVWQQHYLRGHSNNMWHSRGGGGPTKCHVNFLCFSKVWFKCFWK